MADQFVKMTKDGEVIEVAPSLVKEHKALGWEVVEEAKVKAEAEAPAKAEAKAKTEAEAKAKLVAAAKAKK
jgi:hypothetical protein